MGDTDRLESVSPSCLTHGLEVRDIVELVTLVGLSALDIDHALESNRLLEQLR